ncbi:sulfite exporter TauE/SafE family protein [Pseudoclavibacter sp. CFCC 14310]|uniref:sulfite exporter TauE/SafE family protein n=1 Tax=Pseudoclavibacter sp. CFCC 14310 TaxID=2615180 RepID=UPI0013017EC7|nr:sulfite exporter TauE/SafE family protein [Pseudoclavibacter sp. CFCC 14310]KAB1645753.1 sulfite exporter TauE/SafE family protein [Pseudoclavibacter sp. CFCC 14310]
MIAALLILVFIGSFAQRITGLGFGLVVSPFIVLLLGPYSGVMILNLAAIVSASLVLSRVWRDVDWRRFIGFVPTTLLGIVAGGMLAHALPGEWLEAIIGATLIIALTVSQLIGRTSFVAAGPSWIAGSGFAAGAMNSAAGIGGPAMTVYAVLSKWPQKSFSAMLQPFFMMTGVASFLVKFLIDPGRLVSLPTLVWIGIFVMLVLGVTCGSLVAKKVPAGAARMAVLVISYAGGVVTLVRGLLDIFGVQI